MLAHCDARRQLHVTAVVRGIAALNKPSGWVFSDPSSKVVSSRDIMSRFLGVLPASPIEQPSDSPAAGFCTSTLTRLDNPGSGLFSVATSALGYGMHRLHMQLYIVSRCYVSMLVLFRGACPVAPVPISDGAPCQEARSVL